MKETERRTGTEKMSAPLKNECIIKREKGKKRERERKGQREKEREVFVERLTTPHDRIVPLEVAGVDERNGGMEGVKKGPHAKLHTQSVIQKGDIHATHTSWEVTQNKRQVITE